jgi:hypothetical protein
VIYIPENEATVHEGSGLSSRKRAGAKPRTRKRRTSTRIRRAAAPPIDADALKKRRAETFEQQVQSVWSRFGEECRRFADGFNNEIGSRQLHVETHPDTVVVTFASGGEAVVQLDREQKHVACWIKSSCDAFGSCIVDRPPIGLTIDDDRLQFVYGAGLMSEDGLAVRLLTDLVQSNTPSPAESTTPSA